MTADHPAPRSPEGPAASRTRRQWITLGLGAVLLAALCVLAAVWQWHRYTWREAQIALVETNYTATPDALDELLPEPGAVLPADAEWRPAVATGTYRPQDTALLRNRPVGGQPGFHVLVPFETTGADGQPIVLVVDRGFVPLGEDASGPSSVPDPPAGEVEVTMTMRPDEPASSRGTPAGQVQAINTAQVLAAGADGTAWAEGATVGGYGQLRSEDPAAATTPGALPEPDTDPGSHLSYAVQWCIFALGALGGYIVLWRRETRPVQVTAGELLAAHEGPDPDGSGPGRPGAAVRPQRPRRQRVDEDYEDALLDAAEHDR
ncbi:SURF1 family cytochrome oxidase biogenesis protein [Krasilnikoviella flava]|uniref:SURF1-like protein n=1 Tax=Krasilnikoviella flava TaxID=526729 RepID=A0A1T5M312_9MICO|nr:SURF1 family protein [Krasilnikoviella flava]SKC82515.1 Cytochrome oxidase assembly protein ShyY1 [Krasilnikoviella flava]